MPIANPLSNFGSIPTNVGVNMHQTQVGSPGTVFGRYAWMRFDDIPKAGSLSTLSGLASYAKTAKFNVYQIIDLKTWGADTPGHVRDVLLTIPNIDWLEISNEPDLNGITAASYVASLKAIRQAIGYGVAGAKLIGPCISTWEGGAGGTSQTWFNSFISLGGLDYLDAVCIHPYLSTSHAPSTMATHGAQVQALIGRKPLVFSEWGPNTAYVEAQSGTGWTAANAAALYDAARQAAASIGVPICFYDGPNSRNLDGYPTFTSVTAGRANNAIQLVGSTTGVTPGQVLYLFDHAVFATVLTVDSSTQLTFTAPVTTNTNETLYHTDQNLDITNGTSLTTMGTALDALLPLHGGVAG